MKIRGVVDQAIEALARAPRWNELVSTEPVVLLRWTREGLIDLFEDEREVGLRFLSLIASFLLATWDRKAEQGILSVGVGLSPGAQGAVEAQASGERP